MMRRLFILPAVLALTLAALVVPLGLQAQCSAENYAFKSGETLIYDLYFNWKFVWMKVGTASMNITQTVFDGKPAYRSYLITRTGGTADKYFTMRDTLMAYTDLNLTPRYYSKRAFEGKTYRRNEVWYSYPEGKCRMKMRYQRDDLEPQIKTITEKYCGFDMISMLLRARSYDPSKFKVGHRINFLMPDGRECEWKALVYRGKKKFKADGTNTTYRCLVFSFMEKEKGEEEKEIVTFYVTDDKNHLPVRLDLNLRFGTAKAYLKGARGVRNPQTAKIK